MFGLCSSTFCLHTATNECIACGKSFCDKHIYHAVAQSTRQSSQVNMCERCLQEQRTIHVSNLGPLRKNFNQ